MEWYVWMILGVVLIIVEIFVPTFFIALPGIAAIITGFVALGTDELWIQLTVFIVLGIILLVFIRPILLKYFMKTKKGDESNVDAMVGQKVVVITDIDNAEGKGYIKYYSDKMPARSEDGEKYRKGDKVVIKRVDGITAWVGKED